MERLSTQTATQDPNACIALCYQLNQPLNAQAVDNQTAVAVQSLLDSQVVTETQEEEEDIFQCGKCKKQFTSLTDFYTHKQTQCSLQHQLQQQMAIQRQQAQMTIGAGSGAFAPTININRAFSHAHINGTVSTINTNAPILQAHPCLTRSLNQPANTATLTLSSVPSSPLSQLSQSMVFTDDIMSLANLDTSGLGGQTIQMMTGPVHGQTANSSNNVTIFSPITSLAATPNSFTQPGASQLLVQPGQHITLATITDKTLQQQLQQQPMVQQVQPAVQMAPPQPAATTTISQVVQPQTFKSSPVKTENSVNLLSTRKGKTARKAKNSLEIAEEAANSKPKLQCEYCNKEFSKNFDLQQHVRAHTGEKPFQCIVCGRAFAQKSNVKKHMATHKVWPCGISNTLPKQPDPVVENTCETSVSPPTEPVAVTTPVTVTCTTTPVSSDTQRLLKSAVQKFSVLKTSLQEESEEDGPKVKVVVDNSYICQYCPAKFKTYYQLKTHLVNHKGEQVYKCVMRNCGDSFHDLDTFLEHVKSHESEMSYRCHQCHKYFKNLSELGIHQYTHIYMSQGVKSGLRHFQCTKCGNKYTTPEALEHHMSTTSHDYKCPHCEKKFTCERFLRRHLPVHGSEGQFECPQCKKSFKTEHYLKSHILIHTGETPYACDICQAAFNRKDKLKRHMTIHDTVKKFRCPFRSIAGCTKEFNRPDKLKAHIITHSGIKPYKCSVCSKGFSRRPHLVEHERGHNLDYRFKCDKCGKGFFRPKLFNEHKCQPSKCGAEQQFRPRNRRKIGRPRKRLISITPDKLSKARGKQYLSRTRLKGKAAQFPPPLSGPNVTVKQRLQGKQAGKDVKEEEEMAKGFEEANTLSVEVVKALPLITSNKSQGILDLDGSLSVHIPGLDGGKHRDTLGHQVQQISLARSGELVDHYVVHLTESVDGSGPTIQTAFIPAVSGGQIFTSVPGGIQPIAIIEARSFNMTSTDGSATQVLTADGANAILTCTQGHLQGDRQDNTTGSYITVRDGTHIVNEIGQVVKAELEDNGMIMLTDAGDAGTMMATHSGDMMISAQGKVTGGQLVGVDTKDEMVTVEAGGDMMDGTLFAQNVGAEGYVGGQVVVSGDQAYITCNVDYTTADNVLHAAS
ncbi:zinc finger protein 341-like [Physella acuta]|uniref:zinc finger protein 341-like n=1 Tax=Physella acuta TaxID=109671 RepID=UPI0027DDCB13|nr:zinc finger protein 341-like [Physella acuta]